MPFEVELKAIITRDEKYSMVKKLNQFSVKKKEFYIYEDHYYDIGKDLEDERELRIRKISGDKKQIVLTYKNNPIDNSFKIKEEKEVILNSLDNILQIFKHIGLVSLTNFKKHVTRYELHFLDTIYLDFVFIPVLNQDFIEIELSTKNKDNIETKKEQLVTVYKMLGGNEKNISTKYYTDMVIEHKSRIV